MLKISTMRVSPLSLRAYGVIVTGARSRARGMGGKLAKYVLRGEFKPEDSTSS